MTEMHGQVPVEPEVVLLVHPEDLPGWKKAMEQVPDEITSLMRVISSEYVRKQEVIAMNAAIMGKMIEFGPTKLTSETDPDNGAYKAKITQEYRLVDPPPQVARSLFDLVTEVFRKIQDHPQYP